MKIENDKVGLLNFTLKDTDGNLIDASTDEPLAYLHGHNFMLPKLEAVLEGKEVGDKFTCTVPATEAYGDVQEELIQAGIPKSAFGGVEEVSVGMRFEVQGPDGIHVVAITEVNDDTVTVDGNHQLAGLDLVFDIEVAEIRDATAEELAQAQEQATNSCCSGSDSSCCS